MTDDYQPPSCDFHDVLEDHAVRKVRTELRWRDAESGERRETITLITDVFTRDGAEYLTTGDGDEIRLDRLEAVDGQTD